MSWALTALILVAVAVLVHATGRASQRAALRHSREHHHPGSMADRERP